MMFRLPAVLNRLLLLDRDFFHHVALLNGVNDVLTADDLSENGMLVVQMGLRSVRDKELRPIGVGPGVRHGENASAVMPELGMKFIIELVAGISGPGAVRAAGLDHEVADNPMELQSIIKTVLGKLGEVCARVGRFVIKEL